MVPPQVYLPNSEKVVRNNGLKTDDLKKLADNFNLSEYERNYVPPSFTIKELRSAIPSHLFVRSAVKSTLYLIFDLTVSFGLVYLATYLDKMWFAFNVTGWLAYWYLQGVFMFGIWVIAHECGHQAYSSSKSLNDFVGLILHSALLVPYHSWRISHSQHHANTGHIVEDQAFLPLSRDEYFQSGAKSKTNSGNNRIKEAVEVTPLAALSSLMIMLLVAWPMYLTMHSSGKKYNRQTNHFDPNSPIFKQAQAPLILLSDLGVLVTISILSLLVHYTSLWTVTKFYIIPYLLCNAWLVLITYLQHTDVYIPHYDPTTWNYVRGALTTVDRDFGWFLNFALNHITDTHIAHHIFPQLPHYNATEATHHLKKVLGPYYLMDKTPILKAAIRCVKECRFVENEGEILFYRSK